MENAFRHMKNADLPGVIIWGSSNDVNNSEKCHDLKKYIKTVLGPLARKYSTDGLNNIEGNEEITSNTIDRNSRDFEETKIEDNKYPNEIELIPIEKLKSELKSNNMTLSESKSNGTSASDVLKPISSIISNNNMESVNKTAESVANCTDFVVSRQDESITSSSPFV